jgi:hypothetical protein
MDRSKSTSKNRPKETQKPNLSTVSEGLGSKKLRELLQRVETLGLAGEQIQKSARLLKNLSSLLYESQGSEIDRLREVVMGTEILMSCLAGDICKISDAIVNLSREAGSLQAAEEGGAR